MADILISEQNAAAPALSATSDTPVVTPPPAEVPPAPPPEPAAPSEPDGTTGPEEPPEGDTPEPEEPAAAAREDGSPRRQDGRLWRERRLADERLKAADERYDRLAALTERVLAESRGRAEPAPPEVAPSQPALPAAHPQREHFDSPEAYDAAWMQWTTREAGRIAQGEVDRKLSEQRALDQQRQEQQRAIEQRQRIQEAWEDRKAKAIERYPDWEEVALREPSDGGPSISTSMALIIQNSEQGPDIAYHLAKHTEESARIAAMVIPGQFFPPGHPAAGEPVPDVQRQLFELGRIAAIAAAPRPEVTRAPAPIKPLGSNGAARQRSPAEMTTEEYAAYRMPQLQAERRPGMLGIPVDQVRRPQ